MGDINHSKNFPASFRPKIYEVITEKMTEFITTKLPQTGHKPPVALSADKATYKHRSRHFLCAITVVPGSSELLQVISCGQPVVTAGSSGYELAQHMKTGFGKYSIEGDQIESAVFDGVYFHINIVENLNREYGLNEGDILYSWDALHAVD